MLYLVNRDDVINTLCRLYEADDEKESYIELYNSIKTLNNLHLIDADLFDEVVVLDKKLFDASHEDGEAFTMFGVEFCFIDGKFERMYK